MGIGLNCLNIEAESIQINKYVAGKYQESSKIENNDIEELESTVEEDNKEEYSEVSHDTPAEPEERENTPTQSKENQNSVGIPIKAELTA